ncbi:MAG: FAD-binding oxidoreductase, partial [Dehalococcoidia bacterium]
MVAQEVLDSLLRLLGREQVSTVEEELEFYSGDALTPLRAFRAAPVLSRRADVVVRPQSQEQVVELVRLAAQHRVPMVPYGGGTGVMGAVVPVKGGIVFDLKGMNRIVDISEEDRIAVVEAGVVLRDLEEALNRRGLMLGHDPWSLPIATVGGAIATNGVGYRASLYGSMGEQVLGLEVALPNGRVLRTRALPLYS